MSPEGHIATVIDPRIGSPIKDATARGWIARFHELMKFVVWVYRNNPIPKPGL
jgi:hypothetical protein